MPEEPDELMLSDGDVALVAVADDADEGSFVVRWQGETVGRVELLHDDIGDGDLLWVVVPEYRSVGIVERALRLTMGWGFDALGLERIEARVAVDDLDGIRAALRAGLRREGVARGALAPGARRTDTVVLARLRDDDQPDSRSGFIAMLDSSLPTKRAIAQGVLRDTQGRVLLCELTYKAEWDLPGGVVDPGESPARCLTREIREELGVELEIRGLLAVNWLPPWRGWTDATVFVFDLGVAADDLLARITVEPREIRGIHFADEEEWERQVAPYNQRLLAFLSTHAGSTAYLEDGLPAM